MSNEEDDIKKEIEIWKIKKLIKSLSIARGNGTSMISLIMPSTEDLGKINHMLTNEMGTASNIKSRVNRLSVLTAIKSTQERIKLYNNKMPKNGLVVYCGTVIQEGNKEKKVTIDFEPFKPLNTFLYMCDSKFHVEALEELLQSDDKYGFIIVDGNGTTFATLSNNNKNILQHFAVTLQSKTRRGGQSALRFSRLRNEQRHNYRLKISELASKHFISDDKVNVEGIIIAGCAEFKNSLIAKDFLDQRLMDKVISVLDIAYGGENGLNQSIELSKESLSNLQFVKEKKLLQDYFHNIDIDNGLYCFGIKDTLYSLEAGAVSKLIIFQDLDLNRYVLRDKENNEEIIFSKELKDNNKEIVEMELLTDWFSENYRNWGCELHFISDCSAEGNQFKNGFGGIGGILRYVLPMEYEQEELSDFDLDDDDFFI